MRLLTRVALGLLGLAAGVATQDEAAIELDRSGFSQFIESNNVVMVDCEYLCPIRRPRDVTGPSSG